MSKSISGYIIRPIEQTDEPFLWEMLYHALYVSEGQEPLPRDIIKQPEISKYVDQWGKDGDQGYLAIDSQTLRPVGAVWIRSFSKDHKAYGYVSDNIPELSIAILPDHRNHGVGTKLLEQMISNASARYNAISLSVSEDNPAARLYLRLGFEVVDHIGSSITMVKDVRQIK